MKTRIYKSQAVSVIVIMGLLVLPMLSEAADNEPMCPACNKTDTIVTHRPGGSGLQKRKLIKAKCPKCKQEVDLEKQSLGTIHVCETCGSMIEECDMCRKELQKAKVCPSCGKKERMMIRHPKRSGKWSLKTIEVKCPSCKNTVRADDQNMEEIHICNECGTMLEECNICREKAA